MADEKVIETTVQYDDAALAAEFAAKRKQQHEEDYKQPFDPDCILEVDGGIDANTCEVCKENGAEVLVAGSAYFKAADRAAFVKVIQA